MICERLKKIQESLFVQTLLKFLHSSWYLALVAGLMVIANLFRLELLAFYFYLAFGLAIFLFDRDLRGVIPIACCSYMAISYENNPAKFTATSDFYDPAFRGQLIFIIAAAAVLLIARMILLILTGERKPIPKLAVGFGALGLSFVLGGAFSKFYDFRTAFFGFVVIASLCGLYFLFYYGVDWKDFEKGYFAKLFFAIGAGVLIELCGMYFKSGILSDPTLDRGSLFTGWGMYNNVGCIIAMCIPAVLYLSLTERYGWIYTIIGVCFCLGLVLTQSRGSILFGAAVYLAGTILVLVKSGKKERTRHLIVLGIAFFAALLFAVVFREKILSLLSDLIEKSKTDDVSNGRWDIYKNGFKQFLGYPFFGVGFYQCTAWRFGQLPETAFLPPRYHDTYIQLLASGGIFAFVCYLLHRLETVVLFFRRLTVEKMFIGLCILSLLLTSIVDCHFFNMGPGLLYSILLVMAEGEELKEQNSQSAQPNCDE